MSATVQYFVDSSGQIWGVSLNTDGSLSTTLVGTMPAPTTGLYTTTAGSIISSVVGDAQNETGNGSVILDYVDRIHKRILRESQWGFLKSLPKQFITSPGVTDYWLATGTAPTGAVNTGLALSDIWAIDPASVWDRSNNRQLGSNQRSVNNSSANLTTPDAQPRYDVPRGFHYGINNPGLIQLFPAPSNANTYLPVPLAPICTTGTGGSLAARTYYVYATFVDSEGGESTASTTPTVIYVPANSLITVQTPQPVVASADQSNYGKWNVYIGTTATNPTKQNASPLTGSFTEPTSGLITGSAPPSTSTIQPLYGYIIEFTYYVQRQNITTQNQVLQVPDTYRDVVVAGVNWLTNLYMNKDPELTKSTAWKAEFLDGLRQMRRDLNINFRTNDFIGPDSATQLSYSNGLDYNDIPRLGEI